MAPLQGLDAHAKPPAQIREVYKRFQKLSVRDLATASDLIDSRSSEGDSRLSLTDSASFAQLPSDLKEIFENFAGSSCGEAQQSTVFAVNDIPGLYVYPFLLPQDVQLHLLSKLFKRDLCISEHQTNVHMHYDVRYPPEGATYFDVSAAELLFRPKDPAVHKPITTAQYLNKKLRWITLGGQYDWTQKVYPAAPPPPFPLDIKQLMEDLFPMKAEAAIVNLYSPGDTLSLHRDVSEECDQPLVSISLGCDGIFVIGLDEDDEDGKPRIATLRLRSGDAVLMSGESRYAWHSVPKIVEGTCPDWMQHWPGQEYPEWEGWMKGKRINLNVRQMFV